ncbi:hypothetical protein FRC05_003404 [Tulasnella sp. 425]|nr:hypothetical protein FRC05_003404 [Tulasnella sp. 425]
MSGSKCQTTPSMRSSKPTSPSSLPSASRRCSGDDRSTVVGMGVPNKPFLWFAQAAKDEAIDPRPAHVAITADTRAQINEFHKLAMVEGLKCNGPPGLREHYHPTYYGAYVFDPLGNNLEVVTHCPEA